MFGAKFDDARFDPESFRAIRRDERAMTAVPHGGELNTRIFANGGNIERAVRNKWIILRGQNQSRAADLAENPLGARLRVVIVRVAKTAEFRGDDIIKLAHRSHARKAFQFGRRIPVREQTSFVFHAALEARDEMALVDKILPFIERIGACREIERRSYSDD